MSAFVLTYTSLVNAMQTYADRYDSPYVDSIPTFIAMAENRIASEIHHLGNKRIVTNTLTVGEPILAKPDRWRETASFNIGTGTNHIERTTLYERTYEFCRTFWPDPTVTGQPRYYSDYDYGHFLIAGTPNYAYPFELTYYERPEPLSDTNQTNWTTEYAPQLLLYGALLEASPFLKSDERTQMWQAAFDRAAKDISHEDNLRVTDRSSGVK